MLFRRDAQPTADIKPAFHVHSTIHVTWNAEKGKLEILLQQDRVGFPLAPFCCSSSGKMLFGDRLNRGLDRMVGRHRRCCK